MKNEQEIVKEIKEILQNNLTYNSITNEEVREIIIKSYIEYLERCNVYDYEVICDETNNTEEDIKNDMLNVDIYVKKLDLKL